MKWDFAELGLVLGMQCSDAKSYSDLHQPPTNADIKELVLSGHTTHSRRMEKNIARVFCHHWYVTPLGAKKSRYNGTFELEDGTLETPMLILS